MKKDQREVRCVSFRHGSTLGEMVYNQRMQKTAFSLWDGKDWQRQDDYKTDNGLRYLPYQSSNPLVARGIVRFARKPASFENPQALFAAIRRYIHRYVDLTPRFEMIASYYVMLSWVYDAFNEVPYLRLRGHYGSGKTRFLLVVGALCYKPFLSSGASTVAPIFHMLNAISGTLLLDEADFRLSDEKADIVKILNNGTVRDVPVLRCEKVNNREFRPRAYEVFGPKIVASRGFYADAALESRFITELMGLRKLREDIPRSLSEDYKQEALILQNKLLLYRFQHLATIREHLPAAQLELSGRVNQMFLPLLSVVTEKAHRNEILTLAKETSRGQQRENQESTAYHICTIIAAHHRKSPNQPLLIKSIWTSLRNQREAGNSDAISARRIGQIVRQDLGFTTQKSHGVYKVLVDSGRLGQLCTYYGITP